VIAVSLWIAAPAIASDNSLFLFGGRDHDQFLGCLSCYRSEAFSVWNENGEYGSTTNENSIWNQDGKFGARSSLQSPWNPWATSPPLVVDRVGNLYGYFTRNPSYPQRITATPPYHPNHTDVERSSFKFLAWLLDDYEWIITHLDQVRADH
jgi:hypothetical protein